AKPKIQTARKISMERLAQQILLVCLGLAAADPCCTTCQLPKVKVFSTDAPHGFCGEACMEPEHFSFFHMFEANLTMAKDEHPCREQWTPLNDKQYTDYIQTVTHGVGPLSMTLDLYAPTDMPNHDCCYTQIIPIAPWHIDCPSLLEKPVEVRIDGTGPFCCPKGATPTNPCGNETRSATSEVIV
ncbi:Gstm5, partial [Symbiodinium pilosum]